MEKKVDVQVASYRTNCLRLENNYVNTLALEILKNINYY